VIAVTIVAAAGATLSASVSAGQTAQFNLQATPAAGFSGTLAFFMLRLAHGNHLQRAERDRHERSGREFHGNGWRPAAAPWLCRRLDEQFVLRPDDYAAAANVLLMLLAFWFIGESARGGKLSESAIDWKRVAALACLALMVNGCGGGSRGSSVQPPPPAAGNTPKRHLHVTITPSCNARGFHKSLPISPISITLIVK